MGSRSMNIAALGESSPVVRSGQMSFNRASEGGVYWGPEGGVPLWRSYGDPRHGIQVNDHFICRISRRNWVFQLADFRRVLMLPLDLLARRRPSAKRRTTAMFLAPWPAR